MTLHLRTATMQDVPQAAQVLADAFADNPWTRWTVASDNHSDRLLALHATFLTTLAIPYGRVDLTEVDGAVAAAAVWIRADAPVPETVWGTVHAAATELSGERAESAAAAEELLAPHRPAGAHTTLATIGVSRLLQGRGIGTGTLLRGLRIADTQKVATYLETSTIRNRLFYSRHGFVVTAAVDMPDGGPRTWCMWRDPAPLSAP